MYRLLRLLKKSKNSGLLLKISKRIKQLRDEKGVTQEDFYNDTGINVGRIERAVNNVSVITLEKICSYFEISLKEFFKKGF